MSTIIVRALVLLVPCIPKLTLQCCALFVKEFLHRPFNNARDILENVCSEVSLAWIVCVGNVKSFRIHDRVDTVVRLSGLYIIIPPFGQHLRIHQKTVKRTFI